MSTLTTPPCVSTLFLYVIKLITCISPVHSAFHTVEREVFKVIIAGLGWFFILNSAKNYARIFDKRFEHETPHGAPLIRMPDITSNMVPDTVVLPQNQKTLWAPFAAKEHFFLQGICGCIHIKNLLIKSELVFCKTSNADLEKTCFTVPLNARFVHINAKLLQKN